MTGFGRGSVNLEGSSVSVELKSVNNRFLDISIRLPNELQSLDSRIKKSIGERFARGRIEVNLQYERTDDVTYELNRPVIEGYLKVFRELGSEFSLAGDPDINVISRLPNVFQIKRAELDESFAQTIDQALEAAIEELDAMRKSEGEALRDELHSRLGEIEVLLEPIESESESVIEEYLVRLRKRVGEMLAKTDSQIEIDQSRMAQEAAYLADKSDISEEISRLRTHIDHFRKIVDEEKEVGKRLDFLTQELNREANTITSKTSNMVVKENALSIKSEIEKIREQVQNVE